MAFANGRKAVAALREDVLDLNLRDLKQRVIHEPYGAAFEPRIGQFRRLWKDRYRVNLDKDVHPLQFRLLGNYLDQGIALWKFPNGQDGSHGSVKQSSPKGFDRQSSAPAPADENGLLASSDQNGLLASVRVLEAGSMLSLFRGQRARMKTK